MFASARDLFESAREASRDMERVKRQLDALDASASSLGSGGFEPRVRSTPTHDRMGARVATLVDREAVLRRRYEEDRRLVDLALAVLYGTEDDAGLWALVGWRADALALHYLDGLTWAQVGERMCYSESHVKQQAFAALDVADGWGIHRAMAGLGGAEG